MREGVLDVINESFVHLGSKERDTHFVTEGYIFRMFHEEIGLTFKSLFYRLMAHYILLRAAHTPDIA